MTNTATHIITHVPAENRSFLSRKANGQIFGYRNGTQLMFGDDPRQLEARSFMSEPDAMEALRHLAHVDQAHLMGRICRSCGMPQTDRVICPKTNGGVHVTETRNVPEIEVVDGPSLVCRPN